MSFVEDKRVYKIGNVTLLSYSDSSTILRESLFPMKKVLFREVLGLELLVFGLEWRSPRPFDKDLGVLVTV